MHERAERLRIQSEDLIEQDSLAYLDYVEAVRSGQGVAGAQARTIQVPLEIARAAAEVAALAEQSASLGNPKLRADAVVAAMLASAAAEAAAYLVGVNVKEAASGGRVKEAASGGRVGETADVRVDEARGLAAEASGRLRPPSARGSSGGPGRGRGRSSDSRRR